MKQPNTTCLASPSDNVATALVALRRGDTVHIGEFEPIVLKSDIPFGFKFAIRQIDCAAQVTKYGESIGVASHPIAPGELVHTHNVNSCRARGDLAR